MRLSAIFILSVTFLIACQDSQPANDEIQKLIPAAGTVIAHSLDGSPRYPLKETASSLARKDSLLRIAYGNFKDDPTDLNNIIWYGRRLAYLTNYPEAMRVYTQGLHFHPDSPELYRHRGHRYLSMRKFDSAETDLRKAAELVAGRALEIEPDGIPNAQNIPLSSTQFNIWYHLALAHYLQAEYAEAAIAYDSCMTWSVNDDLLTATTDWYYMTAMRLGDTTKAQALLSAIGDDMEVIENTSYHRRLLMYKGEISPLELLDFDNITPDNELDVVTQGYGVANHLLHTGRVDEAKKILRKITETSYWPAFGYIAAEADLQRGL